MSNTIIWRRLDLPGHEFCSIEDTGQGWLLSGTAVFVFENTPCKLDYRVRCASDWRTRSVDVQGRVNARDIGIDISVDTDGEWILNGTSYPSVANCIDIDLGFSPSTNLLPIRRLSLEVGESAEVLAAWLPFPALELEPLAQKYVRSGPTEYRYESGGGAFVRMLEVNDRGLVMQYPGLWEREQGGGP